MTQTAVKPKKRYGITEQEYLFRRDILKAVAKYIRQYFKETGGTFSVKVQENNVIWISGGYTFGVPYDQRHSYFEQAMADIRKIAEQQNLYFYHSGSSHHCHIRYL